MIQPLVENALWHGLGGTAVHGAGSSQCVEVRPGPADRAIILVRNSRHDGPDERKVTPSITMPPPAAGGMPRTSSASASP